MAAPTDPPPILGLFGSAKERRAAWRYWGRDTLKGTINTLVHHGMSALPTDMVSAIGAELGEITGRTRYREANIVGRRAIRLLRPEADVEATMLEAWRQVGRVMAEFSILHRLWSEGRITTEGAEHAHAAWATGRPMLGVTIHTANWEIIPVSLIQMGIPTGGIYQPPGNRFEHRIATRARERYGLTLTPPGRARGLAFYRALLERRYVSGIYVDEATEGRVNAPAFGRPLKPLGNIAYAAKMAPMANAIAVPGYVVREGGARFRAVFLPPLDLPGGPDPDGVMANIAAIDAVIDPIIRRHLEHWHFLFEFRSER